MDFAPPPYSYNDPSESSSIGETSTATATTTTSHSHSFVHTPSSLHTDAIAAAGRPRPSTNSSVDEVIFTPPYSPTLSSYITNHLASSSAAAYFESRPATLRNTGPPSVYNIVVTSGTQPQDLPFPEGFRSHGVHDQDWLTFVNYLLSDFIFSASRDVTDRKECGGNGDGNNTLEITVAEWNEGFFKPRGLQITTMDVNEGGAEATEVLSIPRVPGAWIPHDHIPYDHEILGASSAGRKRGFFGGFKGFQGGSQGGFRMGPIVADNEGFRMGNVFVADQNGVRLGGKSFMRRETTDGERALPWANTRHLRKAEHSSSVSSSSVSASDISSDSESSVGSLPEHGDLRDQQLPVTKQSLLNWLNDPEQPLTKVSVQQLRQEIQSARNNASHHSTEHEIILLRNEVRELLKTFRESKKRQKKEQRHARRERRATKRAHRTERRAAKREARRQKREGRSLKGKEVRRPPWMTSKSTVALEPEPVLPTMPPRPTLDLAFPFTRTASVPSFHERHFGGSAMQDPVPGITAALHSTWPYSRNASYSAGIISSPSHGPSIPGSFPSAFTDSSEQLYAQAKEMETIARRKEETAIVFRTEATSRSFGEKDHLRKIDQAMALEEEAERCLLEANRLRAEALHLDGELARELEGADRRGRSQEHML